VDQDGLSGGESSPILVPSLTFSPLSPFIFLFPHSPLLNTPIPSSSLREIDLYYTLLLVLLIVIERKQASWLGLRYDNIMSTEGKDLSACRE